MPRRLRLMPLAVPCSLVIVCLVAGWLSPSAASAASAGAGTAVVRAGGPASAGQAASDRAAVATGPDVAATAQATRGAVAGVVRAPDGAGLAGVCVLATGQSAIGQSGSAQGMTG